MQGVIIGYGNMGHVHEHALRANGGEVIGIVDVDPALQSDMRVRPSLDDLGDVAPDFVVISSPTYEHAADLDATLEHFVGAGLRGVLLEKPPVRTAEELSRLESLARDFGHICVAEVEHYNPQLEGFLDYEGPVKHIYAERMVDLEFFLKGARPWFLDEEKSGGITLDLMVHDLNLIVGKYGLPDSITEVTGEKQHYDIYDNVRIVLDYGDFDVTLVGSFTSNNEKPIVVSYTVDTGEGQLVFECDNYMDELGDETNPYVIQMKRFMASLEDGKLPFPLASYIAATGLALDVREQLNTDSVDN